MPVKSLSTALAATAFSCALGASAAQAACGSRPGTPNDTKAEPLASAPQSVIRFSWRNTTGRGMNKPGTVGRGDDPHSMYFDISVRDGRGNQVGKDLVGTGPFRGLVYGSRSHRDFTGLGSNATLCFRIRARTEGGTKGCVSQVFSSQVCATTLANPPPNAPKPLTSTGRRRAPGISVVRAAGNVFVVKGTRFLPNAPVTIRVADAALNNIFIVTIGNRRILADAQGALTVQLYNLCKRPGALFFSANDGRKSTADKTGTQWTNTVQQTCL